MDNLFLLVKVDQPLEYGVDHMNQDRLWDEFLVFVYEIIGFSLFDQIPQGPEVHPLQYNIDVWGFVVNTVDINDVRGFAV